MKRTTKRILSTLAAAAMIITLFAGCTVEQKNPDPSAETTATTASDIGNGTTAPSSDEVTTVPSSDSSTTSASSSDTAADKTLDPYLVELAEGLGSFMDALASADVAVPYKALSLPQSEGCRIDLAVDGLPGISVGVSGEALMLAVPEAYDKAVGISASELESFVGGQAGSITDQFGITEDQLAAVIPALTESVMSFADIGEGFGELFVSCLPENVVEIHEANEYGASYTVVIDSDLVNAVINSLKAQVEADINVLSQASEGIYAFVTGLSSALTELGVDPEELFGDLSSLSPGVIAGMLAQTFTGIAPVEIANPIVFEVLLRENFYSDDSRSCSVFVYDETMSLFNFSVEITVGDVFYFDLSTSVYDEFGGATQTVIGVSSDAETFSANVAQYADGGYTVFSVLLFYGVYESYNDGEGEIVDFLLAVGLSGIDDAFCFSGRCVFDESDGLSINIIGDISDDYGNTSLFTVMGMPVLESVSLTVTPADAGDPLGMETVSVEEFSADADAVAAVSDAFAQSELAQILGSLFAVAE